MASPKAVRPTIADPRLLVCRLGLNTKETNNKQFDVARENKLTSAAEPFLLRFFGLCQERTWRFAGRERAVRVYRSCV